MICETFSVTCMCSLKYYKLTCSVYNCEDFKMKTFKYFTKFLYGKATVYQISTMT